MSYCFMTFIISNLKTISHSYGKTTIMIGIPIGFQEKKVLEFHNRWRISYTPSYVFMSILKITDGSRS